GGTVVAESAGKGKGSTFTILLPLMAPGTVFQFAGEPARDTPVPVIIKDVRILVAEDDPGTREALVEMLRMGGAVPCAVETAEEAFEVFEEFKPSVLL